MNPPTPLAGPDVIHLVVSSIYPARGGMQDSALRVAAGLVADGREVFVYTFKQPTELLDPGREHAGLTLVHLGGRAARLLEPFAAAGEAAKLEIERERIEVMLLRGEVERRLAARAGRRHLLLSFYATSAGFRTQQVADRLGLPHLASFRGSDYARDAHSAAGRQQIAFVVDRAQAIVTTNREQAAGLRKLFAARQPIHTIHNGMEGVERPVWSSPAARDRVQLLSDSGFSGRKATQLLLQAVADLVDRGSPVRLTLVGGVTWPREAEYWHGVRREYEARYRDAFCFREHLPRTEMDGLLRQSHLYCSATLAEGCSLSRVRALTLGIPIVTTRCGALVEVAEGCRHVLLAAPGDGGDLAAKLEEAVRRSLRGELAPDPHCVADWRRHFALERERSEWRAAALSALGEE